MSSETARSSRARPPAPPGPRLLYLGVVLFALLAVLTARSIREEWRRRIGESRAQAIYALVADKMPARPTETPGVSAWLHVELERYRRQIADPERARLYGELASWHDEASLPASLTALREVLAMPPAGAGGTAPAPAPRLLTPAEAGDPEAGSPPLQFRDVAYLDAGGPWLVVTRRRALGGAAGAPSPSDRFVAGAAARLAAMAAALQAALARHPLPTLAGDRPPRVVRLYAVAEDGTLVSLPFAAGDPGRRPATPREQAFAEGREFRKLAELPNFAASEFEFRFDFRDPAAQAYWSGLYVDLGGQGVVATLLVPAADPALGAKAVLSADLSFGIDWPRFAAGIEPPMTAAVVHVTPPPAGRFRPWAAMLRGLRGLQGRRGPRSGPDPGPSAPALRAAVADLAAREARLGGAAEPFYLYQGVAAGRGAVAAVQVAATTWLLVLFPAAQPGFPALPVALLALLLVLLLAGFEANRRRAVAAQGRAERAFDEKENLLNTMQVPLMVVDPNTDMVVYGNQAAAGLGIASGTRVTDLIAPDPRAREHYDRMQVAAPEPRRAYGVPLAVRGPGGERETRYALVRSVAVTAPIAALHADERHRLGVLFLLEPDSDLALFSADLVAETRADERQRLSGLLTHGVDTLARVLASVLANPSDRAAAADPFAAWLAAYLERRVLATAWLLARWDAEPPLPPDSAVEAAQARGTIERFQTICARVRDDAALRSRLHWDNGVLAAPPAGPPAPEPTFRVEIDWPDDYWFACPLAGGFGFFLGEVLGNAVRHGRPGTRPSLSIALDRVRRELLFTVENEPRAAAADGAADRGDRPYGGRQILERLAHLFEWRELRFEPGGGSATGLFRVTWRVPVSERGDPKTGD